MHVLDALKSLKDPLRSPAAADKWVAAVAADTPVALQKKAVEVVGRFVAPGRQVGPGEVEALLKVDARLEPVIAELTRDYAANYVMSAEIELKLWQQVFDLVKAFIAAYQAALRVGHAHAEDRHWRAVLPWVLVRLTHYRGLDGKFRLFRYSRWSPAQWREFHELYEFARKRGWEREQLVLGAATFSRPGVCFEQEYLQTLLLMRLDSGNFTADHVQWIARQLEDWTPSLMLMPPPGEGATFFVDATGDEGLRRTDRPQAGGRALFLDVGPVYSRIIERMRWLPEKDEPEAPDELPVREQRLLLTRLAALFGPDALAIAPRAARYAVDSAVRVVFELDALCYAIGETERSAAAAGPGVHTGVTDMPPSSFGGEVWRMADASESGCRLTTQRVEAPARLGDLLGIRTGDAWLLGVVRRMQRLENDEVSVGVEILARRFVPVLLRTWEGASADARPGTGRPFLGIYVPAHAENRQTAERSLVGPAGKVAVGGLAELDTGKARYLIRFASTLAEQATWAWAPFNAVRSLSD